MNIIYEMPVYCGRLKEWRVLNLSTGTVYSMSFATEAAAAEFIPDGEARNGALVRRVTCRELVALMYASGFPMESGAGERRVCARCGQEFHVIRHRVVTCPTCDAEEGKG